MEPILQTIPQTITHSMNQYLLNSFTAHEVTTALHQSHPSKAPRPDGLPTFFYQTYWPIFEDDIIHHFGSNKQKPTITPFKPNTHNANP